MISQAGETLFSPTMLLWLAASLLAAVLLIGAASRRKAKLTESLRDYVDQNTPKPTSSAQSDSESD
tara:strand:- start:1040005 stop:1040202 length:198 start_codon:yes stop_codon:yes gene_type:complete